MGKPAGNCPTSWIVQEIEALQNIQKKFPPDSYESKRASRELKPLWAAMAARQAENGGEPDWRKWRWYISDPV